MTDRPTGKHYGEFLSKLSPIECLQSHTKKVVLHEFRGDLSEVVFLQHLTQRVNQLQNLTIVLSKDILLSVDDMKVVLRELATPSWASKSCIVCLWDLSMLGTSTRHPIFRLLTLLIQNMDKSSSASLKKGGQTVWKRL